MVLPFRFGVNLLAPTSRAAWVEKCRRAEKLGFDVIGVPDHLGLVAPFPALMLAAEVTERVRLNTFVLNTPFYNPTLLARDVAGLDQLSGGRFELGLGTGYVQSEFESAGIRFPSAGRRVEHVAETVRTLRRLFADPDYQPRPVQPGGPPVLMAAWGERALRVAAEHAEIIAFVGGGTADSGHITVADSATTAKKVDFVRGLLGSRAETVEFNLLIQGLTGHADRAAFLEQLAPHLPPGNTDDLEDIPVLLVGTPEEQARTLRERRDRFGFNYLTVNEFNIDKFAPLIPLLRGT
ncbi:TIGR03621 family F420-dependent LLM class oxidoreductase [Nocardia sp. NPDC127526]|uniref:TIGR03621 family F420-dependent LLM class oxidoreductase n=1 Tax=Nocardia sp. NPDC127526 TaxID=3345393 RepID=UPI0036316754